MYLEGVRNISFVLLSQQHHHWSLCIVSFSEDFTSVHLYGKNCHLCRRQPPQMNTYLKAYNVSYPVTPLIRGCAGSQSRVFWCCLLLSSRLSVLPKSLPSQQKWQQDQKVCHFQALWFAYLNCHLLGTIFTLRCFIHGCLIIWAPAPFLTFLISDFCSTCFSPQVVKGAKIPIESNSLQVKMLFSCHSPNPTASGVSHMKCLVITRGVAPNSGPYAQAVLQSLKTWPIHLNQVCWSRETWKACRAVCLEDQDWEKLF